MNGNCHFVYGAAVGSMVALNLNTISTILPNISNNNDTITLFILGGLIGLRQEKKTQGGVLTIL